MFRISPALWVAFEGADGTGKSVTMEKVAQQLGERLCDYFQFRHVVHPQYVAQPDGEHYREIIQTRHPGSTPLGQLIKKLTRSPGDVIKMQPSDSSSLNPIIDQMLLAVDHQNFMIDILEPALARSAIVLSDRCNPISCIPYGLESGLTLDQIDKMYDETTPQLDRLFILHCHSDTRQARLSERKASDKFESLNGVACWYSKVVAWHQAFNTIRSVDASNITSYYHTWKLINKIVKTDNIRCISTTTEPLNNVVTMIVDDVINLYEHHYVRAKLAQRYR